MNFEILFAYSLSVVIIVVIPGPNIILVINDSIKHGFGKSILTISGVTAGMSLLFVLSLCGLATLLTLFSSLFIIIKWIGVCYLIYLGVTQIISSFKQKPVPQKQMIKNTNFFLKGFIVSATNPKGLLFAGAFFPQFLNRQAAIAPQIIILCSTFLLLSTLITMIYAYAGNTTGRLFKTDSFKRWTERISGVFLILFGIGLSVLKKNH